MDPWPPAEFDFAAKLKELKLREVMKVKWRIEDEIDSNGLRKVYPIPGFKGVYKNSAGERIDVRPEEGKPSFNHLATKSTKRLAYMFRKALRNQIADYKGC